MLNPRCTIPPLSPPESELLKIGNQSRLQELQWILFSPRFIIFVNERDFCSSSWIFFLFAFLCAFTCAILSQKPFAYSQYSRLICFTLDENCFCTLLINFLGFSSSLRPIQFSLRSYCLSPFFSSSFSSSFKFMKCWCYVFDLYLFTPNAKGLSNSTLSSRCYPTALFLYLADSQSPLVANVLCNLLEGVEKMPDLSRMSSKLRLPSSSSLSEPQDIKESFLYFSCLALACGVRNDPFQLTLLFCFPDGEAFLAWACFSRALRTCSLIRILCILSVSSRYLGSSMDSQYSMAS